MNILFCGTYIPPENVKDFKCSSEAGNNFQHNLIENLKVNHQVRILSYIGFWKGEKKLSQLSDDLQKNKIQYIIKTGKISMLLGCLFYYIKFFKLLRHSDIIVLYNYYYINFLILFFAKTMHIKTALIIADGHTEERENKTLLIMIRKYIAEKVKRDYLKFDKLIILSRILYKKIEHKDKILFQGAINVLMFKNFALRQNTKLNIMYSGFLDKSTGVDLWVKAISQINNKNIEYVFTGWGPLSELIKKLSVKNTNILYRGFVSREEYYRMLNESDIVVNPRNMNLLDNKENFPSKMLEYLASGRVILSTRFSGNELFMENAIWMDSTALGMREQLENIVKNFSQIKEGFFVKNRKKAENYDWKKQIIRVEKFLLK